VVDVAVDPWRFDHQSNGSRAEAHEDGSSLSKGPLERKQIPPEIDFVLLTDPQKSASTYVTSRKLERSSKTRPVNFRAAVPFK
jgi:hypothetical protein